MAVNASKCAIMAINCDDAVEMTLQRQTIRSADNYTYLGYIMNSKWDVGKSAAMERIREELGITSVFLHTSTARERAYIKRPESKTRLSDLIKQPIKAKK
ncbi:hypothetical protein AYI70_g10143 [Smittium culicis]|uniref:Uncharacterized protein n=1 Tax=Smittium culicis TaxID=133412 RepID=A0A1R1X7Y1_9FUNG|nr:hypothetical protein AYI70_g10143 [Smittium culicis]